MRRDHADEGGLNHQERRARDERVTDADREDAHSGGHQRTSLREPSEVPAEQILQIKERRASGCRRSWSLPCRSRQRRGTLPPPASNPIIATPPATYSTTPMTASTASRCSEVKFVGRPCDERRNLTHQTATQHERHQRRRDQEITDRPPRDHARSSRVRPEEIRGSDKRSTTRPAPAAPPASRP